MMKARIISEIATHLDLNSLHDLSRTCRQIRANLLQHRRQLIPHTLRCVSDVTAASREPGFGAEEDDTWITRGPAGIRIPRLTSGKFGACARDMVGECRRCGTVVCRVSTSLVLTTRQEQRLTSDDPELYNESTFQHRPQVSSSKTLPHMHQSTSVPPHHQSPRTP